MNDAPADSALDDAYAFCEARVRDGDRAAWLAALFVPVEKRSSFHALSAFALEASSVRNKVKEPLAGELRLQWWTDAIEGEARGNVLGHPVAVALLDTIRRHGISRLPLIGYLDVQRADLYDDPVPTLRAFDERADRGEGALFAARARILAGNDASAITAAHHAGRAEAVLARLRSLSRGSTRPLGIPVDVLEPHGVTAADLRAHIWRPEIAAALNRFTAHAFQEIAALRLLRPSLGAAAGAAFLTASLIEPTLRRGISETFDPFATRLELPQWRQQWILWRAARRNGIL